MASRKNERLPGIDGRYEFTNKFILRTLHNVRARLAELSMEAERLKELRYELEAYASQVNVEQERAVCEFIELSDAIIDHCLKLRERLDGPHVLVKVVERRDGKLPPEPSDN